MSGGAWAICDRCGWRRRHRTCRTEWTGLFVCTDCYDPRPPWLDPPYIDPLEGTPVRDARFDRDATNPSFIDAESDPVLPEDL